MYGGLETSGFTIERLRTFCRIAEAGSITSAAKGDATRQSQFSRQVKELEGFFGTKLLERAGKSVRLTDSGRKLALLTQTYFHAVEEIRATTARHDRLRIGAGESVLRWMVAPRIGQLQGLAAGVRFEFRTQRTAQLVEELGTGHLDLAIVRKDAVDDSLNALPCGSMKYALVVPRTLLPGQTAAGFHLLPKIPFAMLSGDGVLAKGVRALVAKAGVNLEIQVQAENFSLLLSTIENAELAAVLPTVAAAGLSKERFAVVEMEGVETLTRELLLVYSPQAAALREIIRRLAPRISALFQRAV